MTWILWERTALDLARGTMGFGVNWLLQSTLLISMGLLFGYLLRRHGAPAQSAVYRTALIAAVACPLVTWSLSLAGFSGWSIEIPAGRSPLAADPVNGPLASVASPDLPNGGTPSAWTDSKSGMAIGPANSIVASTIAGGRDLSAAPIPSALSAVPASRSVPRRRLTPRARTTILGFRRGYWVRPLSC